MARKRPPATPQAPEPPSGRRKRSQPAAFVEYEWRGIKCIRKWPRRRTAAENQKHFASCQLFIDRVKQMKQELAASQVAAAEMSKGSALLPRDVQMMLMANTFYGTFELDGQLYFPVHVMTEVSQALDVLAREPGSILYRSEDGWIGLLPGQSGNVLALEGSPPRPIWTPPAGGGGSGLVPRWTVDTVSSRSHAAKGSLIDPDFTVQATHLVAAMRPASNMPVRIGLWRLDEGTIEAQLALSPDFDLLGTTPNQIRWPLPGPITLEQGKRYAVMTVARGGTGTRVNGIYTSFLPISGFPFNVRNPRFCRIASNNPQPGDPLEFGSLSQTSYLAGVEA